MDRQLLVEKWPLDEKKRNELAVRMDKILEIRLFGKESEYRLFRTALGRAFYERMISDEGRDVIEERQYLDIDSTKSVVENGMTHVVATGGGSYDLPFVCGVDHCKKLYILPWRNGSGLCIRFPSGRIRGRRGRTW